MLDLNLGAITTTTLGLLLCVFYLYPRASPAFRTAVQITFRAIVFVVSVIGLGFIAARMETRWILSDVSLQEAVFGRHPAGPELRRTVVESLFILGYFLALAICFAMLVGLLSPDGQGHKADGESHRGE